MKRSDVQVERLSAWRTGRPAQAPAIAPAILDWATTRLDDAGGSREAEVVQTLDLLDELNADGETLTAALVYDCGAPPPEGAPVSAAIGNLLTGQREAEKVWSIYAQSGSRGGIEGLRRLLLAIIRDLRVVLILLARQLVQMRRAGDKPDDERRLLAQLTTDIHSPLANRLGIWQLKWELEDLAFRHLHPDVYKRIAKLLDERRVDRERFIEDFKQRLRQALADVGIRGDVAGRPKHIYSIWKKMQRKGVPFSELYDIRAVRVLVDSVADCYAALGAVHGTWVPLPAEFDDYIANPKGNHYRSLHTAVLGPDGRTVEIQIRTREMHEHAELGVAAHWRYKEGGGADADLERKIAWMRQLLDGKDGEARDDEDAALAAELTTALVEDRIYVLTPQGQVIDLPHGGTVLDFAYHVHTEVGHRCRGAKVNGRIVPLTHQPRTGDRIEILTGKTAEPRRDWLLVQHGFLASARARDKVRAWFHRLDLARNIAAGRELLERELKRLALPQSDLLQALPRLKLQKLDDLYVAVALGDIGPAQVARALHEASQPEPAKPVTALAKPPKPATGFTIEGVGNLLTQLARCCQPVSGDPIVGYLTKGRGVSIHREGCAALERLVAAHPERMLPIEWGKSGGQSFSVDVVVRAFDRKWLIKDLTNVIGTGNAHILGLNSRVNPDDASAELKFSLKVSDFAQLGQLLSRMAGVPGVTEVRRTSAAT